MEMTVGGREGSGGREERYMNEEGGNEGERYFQIHQQVSL